jgi:hypothetical protein
MTLFFLSLICDIGSYSLVEVANENPGSAGAAFGRRWVPVLTGARAILAEVRGLPQSHASAGSEGSTESGKWRLISIWDDAIATPPVCSACCGWRFRSPGLDGQWQLESCLAF